MKTSIVKIVQTFIICLVLLLPSFACAQPTIRVGILSNQPNVVVCVDTDYQLIDAVTGSVLSSFSGSEKALISMSENNFTINGKIIHVNKINVVIKNSGIHYIEVNRRLYRGNIDIHKTYAKNNGITVVNTLPVEEYLFGVLTREISPEWPWEAVKAQAVAARTYALSSLNKYANDGYDVSAGTDSQVYGGVLSEHPKASAAVLETRGMVITFKGKIISALFHNNSGGYTENSENVWGNYLPYLRGVEDYDKNTPHYKWEKAFSAEDIENALERAGYHIGKLQAIELSHLSSPPVNASDRGISGRVKSIQLIGRQGSINLNGNKVRTILGLKSTLFDINTIVPNPKELDFPITDSYGDREVKHVKVSLPPYNEKGFVTDKSNIRRITGRKGEKIVFNGFGWGHGLGMSQWGAKVMAEKGPQNDAEYYKTILKHYYQGVQITKTY